MSTWYNTHSMKCEFCDNEVIDPKLRCITVCEECEKQPSIGFWSMVIGNEESMDELLSPKIFAKPSS